MEKGSGRRKKNNEVSTLKKRKNGRSHGVLHARG